MYTGHSMLAPQDLSALPVGVSMIVDRCTKRDPDQRFQSVNDLRIAFQSFSSRRGEITANERARELVARAITEQDLSEDELGELANLISRYQDDVDLLHELGVQAPLQLFEDLFAVYPSTGELLIRVFVGHVTSQGWGYEYTDKIVSALSRMYQAAAARQDLRGLLVRTMVEIGVSHNRFYVMDVTAGIIARVEDDEEANRLAHELVQIQDLLEPIASRLKIRSLRPALKELLVTFTRDT